MKVVAQQNLALKEMNTDLVKRVDVLQNTVLENSALLREFMSQGRMPMADVESPRSSHASPVVNEYIGKECDLRGGWPLRVVARGIVQDIDPNTEFGNRRLEEGNFKVHVNVVYDGGAVLPLPHDDWRSKLGKGNMELLYVLHGQEGGVTHLLEKDLWALGSVNEEYLKALNSLFSNFPRPRATEPATLKDPPLGHITQDRLGGNSRSRFGFTFSISGKLGHLPAKSLKLGRLGPQRQFLCREDFDSIRSTPIPEKAELLLQSVYTGR
ncbi:hypothetical protein IFM89_015296 [Coptis chinensis]|uniref:Uncharacterized protein n=1 Tax=Coptis chinensis TaxID=261450 RepID=A0A835IP29_9MAGN|nr:hypothetical protein IFM89_015296 [Coptis chinensis]